MIDALDLAKATMSKVYQNLTWAVAYNLVAVPIAAGVLLPQYDFAMTPSLSGTTMTTILHTNTVLYKFLSQGILDPLVYQAA